MDYASGHHSDWVELDLGPGYYIKVYVPDSHSYKCDIGERKAKNRLLDKLNPFGASIRKLLLTTIKDLLSSMEMSEEFSDGTNADMIAAYNLLAEIEGKD